MGNQPSPIWRCRSAVSPRGDTADLWEADRRTGHDAGVDWAAKHALHTMLAMLDVEEVRVAVVHSVEAAGYARQAGYQVDSCEQDGSTVFEVRASHTPAT